jgi:hypothetical protein
VSLTVRKKSFVSQYFVLAINITTEKMVKSQTSAKRNLKYTQASYDEVGDSHFGLAQRRMGGIIAHYRAKEKGQIRKTHDREHDTRPKAEKDWQAALPQRASADRSRARSRSNSGNRRRSRERRAPPSNLFPTLPTPDADALSAQTATYRGRNRARGGRGYRGRGGRGGQSGPQSRKRPLPQDLSAEAERMVSFFRAYKAPKNN